MTAFFWGLAIFLLLNAFLCLWRAFAGPTAVDRILATNVVGTKALIVLVLLGLSRHLQPVLDRELHVIAAALPGDLPPAEPWPAMTSLRRSRRSRAVFGGWLRDIGRLAVAEVRQHPSSWPQSESIDTDPAVVSTRRGIQRYARDEALNVAAIFLVMLLLAAVLWRGA